MRPFKSETRQMQEKRCSFRLGAVLCAEAEPEAEPEAGCSVCPDEPRIRNLRKAPVASCVRLAVMSAL